MNDNALESMIEQGYSQLREGQFDEAIATFSACLVINGKDDRAFRGRGLAYIQLKNPLMAEPDFRSAKEINSSEPENWMGLGLALAMQNQIYEAIKVYEDLLESRPQYVPGFIQLGRLHFKIGVISKGRDYFKHALTLRPTLEQRRMIEAVFKEEDKLDTNRYYRPDFDRLRKEQEKK